MNAPIKKPSAKPQPSRARRATGKRLAQFLTNPNTRITLRQFAAEADVSEAAVYKWVHEEAYPTYENCQKLNATLDRLEEAQQPAAPAVSSQTTPSLSVGELTLLLEGYRNGEITNRDQELAYLLRAYREGGFVMSAFICSEAGQALAAVMAETKPFAKPTPDTYSPVFTATPWSYRPGEGVA